MPVRAADKQAPAQYIRYATTKPHVFPNMKVKTYFLVMHFECDSFEVVQTYSENQVYCTVYDKLLLLLQY